MLHKAYILAGSLVICLSSFSLLAAQDSHHTISFQGYLTDDVGNPLNDVVPITFKIYRSSGSDLYWTEAHPSVAVINGVFNVRLGSIVPLADEFVFFDEALEVGISVDGDTEMSPRTPLTAVPYAINLAGALRVQLVDDNVDEYVADNIIGGKGVVDADARGVTISGGGNTDEPEVRNRGYGNYGTIGGGLGNAVGGRYGTATEPTDNPFATVGGGYRNEAFAAYSTIPGGYLNRANGPYSFVAGYRGIADHTGTFVWADSTSASFTSTGKNQFLVRANGGVGIGTASPTNMLHVVEGINGSASAQNHVGLIDNSSTGTSADVLALRVARTTAPGATNSFITFIYDSNTAAGFIRGNGSGGIELFSSAADYAELLERADPGETMEAGEVVGVRSGKISLKTDEADRYMVVTDRSAVLGNMPADPKHEHLFERVAFLGQVPVKIRGPVSSGDFIVPSGLGDGTTRAVAADAISIEDLDRIVGRAWESSADPGIKRVIVEVGLDQIAVLKGILGEQHRSLQSQKKALQAQSDRIELLERMMHGLLPHGIGEVGTRAQ